MPQHSLPPPQIMPRARKTVPWTCLLLSDFAHRSAFEDHRCHAPTNSFPTGLTLCAPTSACVGFPRLVAHVLVKTIKRTSWPRNVAVVPPPPAADQGTQLPLSTKFCPSRQGAPGVPAALDQLRLQSRTPPGKGSDLGKVGPRRLPSTDPSSLPSPTSCRRPGPAWGIGLDIAPLPGPWRHLGPARPELGEPSRCAARRWGLSISRIDKLPLGEGRAVSPRRRVTQGNLSRKNPLPAASRAGADRAAAPAPSRAPAPRGSPARPLSSLGRRARTRCWADCKDRSHRAARVRERRGRASGGGQGDHSSA